MLFHWKRSNRSQAEAKPVVSKKSTREHTQFRSLPFEREATSAETDYKDVAAEGNLLQNLTVPSGVQMGPYALAVAIEIWS
jgi:hypothetical protein